jgi:hypothetical protein
LSGGYNHAFSLFRKGLACVRVVVDKENVFARLIACQQSGQQPACESTVATPIGPASSIDSNPHKCLLLERRLLACFGSRSAGTAPACFGASNHRHCFKLSPGPSKYPINSPADQLLQNSSIDGSACSSRGAYCSRCLTSRATR